MRYGLFLLLALSIPAAGQKSSSGNAKTSGSCSPAITGNNNTIRIDGCGIGAEQEKKIVTMLKAALTNHSLAEVNKKLEELAAVASKPVQDCVGGNCAEVNNGTQSTSNGPRQSIIDNEGGTIGYSTCTDCSISGAAPSGTNNSVVQFGKTHVGKVDMQDIHICNAPESWGSFLDCIAAASGSVASIKTVADSFQGNVSAQLERISDASRACREELGVAIQRILDHTTDEKQTVSFLRSAPPSCLKSSPSTQ